MSDPRSVQNITAEAGGWESPSDYSCNVEVVDFCLDDAFQVTDGRWGFNFTIRVEANSKCGALTASMDLVQDGNYLGEVSIDGNDIIDVFNCQCEKTFTVYADYDGSPGEFYGQMDIRNGQHQVVKITDSGTMEINY